MSQHYERIMIAVDGSYESELAFEKGVNVALRNKAELILTHVIDTRALQSIATFDTYIYEQLEEEAKGVLEGFEKKAHERGIEKSNKSLNLVILRPFLRMIFLIKKRWI